MSHMQLYMKSLTINCAFVLVNPTGIVVSTKHRSNIVRTHCSSGSEAW
jgi:filamentous hemagglutinin family protein